MAWTLTHTGSATSVELSPISGDITIEHDRTTGVLYALRGTTPFVQDGPLRAATINVPSLHFGSSVAWQQLVDLVALGGQLVLTDDTAVDWDVRVVGGIKTRIADTADRATDPHYLVDLTLIGV